MEHSNHSLKDGRTLTVREAVPEDAAAILEHIRIVGGETDYLLADENGLPGDEESEAKFLQNIQQRPRDLIAVGIIDGELAAVFSVIAGSRPRNCHNGNLGISVKKKFWGLGIGTIIMEHFTVFAREVGLINLTLGVRRDNDRARALYEKAGFKVCGAFTNHLQVHGEFFDEVLMEKRID